MKRKKLYIILVICVIISSTLLITIIIPRFKAYYKAKKQEELIKNATIIVELNENLSIPFMSEAKVTDFITNINGTIIDDYTIDTSEVGEKTVNFEYVNEENITIPYSYTISVEDKTPPVIWLGSTYNVTTNYEGSLLEDIVCADDYDDNPTCEIIGTYDTTQVGSYQLKFKATDSSGNITEKSFKLSVTKPSSGGGGSSTQNPSSTPFSEVVANYKNENTKIGIDVSSWQGDIDFDAVKNAGVEFVFIRVGSTKGIGGEYFEDRTFRQNIEGFNRVGIPVGIYFYSYANSEQSAIDDAKWVLEHIQDYKISLPVVYDWESWSFYNEFHQSFYSTTKNAKAFLNTIKASGYEGALYSSKNYLEKVWFDTGYDVWLAHYVQKTSYQGDYTYWQMCSDGKIDGIKGYVDINVMYTNK